MLYPLTKSLYTTMDVSFMENVPYLTKNSAHGGGTSGTNFLGNFLTFA